VLEHTNVHNIMTYATNATNAFFLNMNIRKAVTNISILLSIWYDIHLLQLGFHSVAVFIHTVSQHTTLALSTSTA